MEQPTAPDRSLTQGFDFERDFIAFVDRTIEWFARRSFRNQHLYNGSRFILVVLSAVLPVLISNHYNYVSTPVSIAIAILAGLDAQFKPGESWKHQRAAELTLRGLKRDYEHDVFNQGALAAEDAPKPLDKFYIRVMAFLKDEPNDFWRSQATTWSHQ